VNIYQHNFYLPQHFLNVFVLVDLLALFVKFFQNQQKIIMKILMKGKNVLIKVVEMEENV